MIDVTVVLLSGGLPSTSMVPLEIFSSAGTLWSLLMRTPSQPRFRVRTATVDGRPTHNMVPVGLAPTMALRDVGRTDLVVVPTAGIDVEVARDANRPLIEWLARRRSKTAIAGICSGVPLLAEAGLLDGRPATTHWAIVERCRTLYPKVDWQADKLVTERDNIFCGGGLYASIDLSLYLVERFCGHEVAVQTAKALLLGAPRRSQAPYAAHAPNLDHDDEPIGRAQRWLHAHHRESIDLDALAVKMAMSPRHFARRFKAATGEAPLAYVHRLRIDAARHHLENGRRSVQEVSRHVGYEDVAFFRHLFRRHTGTSPREYRTRFGVGRAA